MVCCAAGLSLLTMSGCASSGSKVLAENKKTPDPILGEVHPAPAPPFGPAAPLADRPKQVSGTSASRPVDDPLFPSMPTSNAYLAGRPTRLPGSETLQISDGRAPGQFQLAGGTPIVRPIPRDTPVAGAGWTASGSPSDAPSATVSANSAASFGTPSSNFVDPTVAILQSRGVASHRVETLADGNVRVTAIVPRRDDPSRQLTYEAVARDFNTAAQLIVQKIDAK